MDRKLHACGTRGGTELNRAQLGAKYGAQEPQDIYRISSMERVNGYEPLDRGSTPLSCTKNMVRVPEWSKGPARNSGASRVC